MAWSQTNKQQHKRTQAINTRQAIVVKRADNVWPNGKKERQHGSFFFVLWHGMTPKTKVAPRVLGAHLVFYSHGRGNNNIVFLLGFSRNHAFSQLFWQKNIFSWNKFRREAPKLVFVWKKAVRGNFGFGGRARKITPVIYPLIFKNFFGHEIGRRGSYGINSKKKVGQKIMPEPVLSSKVA